jgi:hypothetical protein
MRIGYALLPEVLEEESWDLHKDKINEFSEILAMSSDDIIDKIKLKYSPTNSMELIWMICLPLMGFNGSPLSYSSIFDLERSFHRELALRVMKALDPKRGCNNLVLAEEQVAISLDLPSF